MAGDHPGLDNNLGKDVAADGRRLLQRVVVLVVQDVRGRDVRLADRDVDPGTGFGPHQNFDEIMVFETSTSGFPSLY